MRSSPKHASARACNADSQSWPSGKKAVTAPFGTKAYFFEWGSGFRRTMIDLGNWVVGEWRISRLSLVNRKNCAGTAVPRKTLRIQCICTDTNDRACADMDKSVLSCTGPRPERWAKRVSGLED